MTIREGMTEIIAHGNGESSWQEFCQKGSEELPEEPENRIGLSDGRSHVTERGRCKFSLVMGKGSLNFFEWRKRKPIFKSGLVGYTDTQIRSHLATFAWGLNRTLLSLALVGHVRR